MNSFSSLDTKNKQDSIFVKVLIPSNSGGAVIGKAGQAIVKAQEDTGATVKISKVGEYFPDTTERICIVYGDKDSIIAMIDYISSCISDKTDFKGFGRLDRQKQTILVVPNSSAGLLIGREGETISNIKKDSGAFIQVSPKMFNQTGGERFVTITGNTEQRSLATKLVIEKILEDPKLCSFPNLIYGEAPNTFSGYSNNTMKMGSPNFDSNSFDNSPYHYTVGDNNLKRPANDDDDNEASGKKVAKDLTGTNQGGGIPRNGSGNYHYSKMAGGPGAPHSPPLMGGGGGNSTGTGPSVLTSSSSKHMMHYATSPSSPPNTNSAAPQSFHQMDYMASSSVNGIIRTLEVDQEYVGAIIGPKGASIVELQEITNTSIKISKKPDQQSTKNDGNPSDNGQQSASNQPSNSTTNAPNNGKRTVSIYGFYQDVSRAYLLICDKIKTEQMRRQRETGGGINDTTGAGVVGSTPQSAHY